MHINTNKMPTLDILRHDLEIYGHGYDSKSYFFTHMSFQVTFPDIMCIFMLTPSSGKQYDALETYNTLSSDCNRFKHAIALNLNHATGLFKDTYILVSLNI